MKSYVAPEALIILFEVDESIMDDIVDSRVDPFTSLFPNPNEFQQWLNDQPNGTIIDKDQFK